MESSWPAENFTNRQREVIFVRDFQFFGLILNENTNFYCRVNFFLIQAVCMCIFHQFCSIFHVFLRIDSSVNIVIFNLLYSYLFILSVKVFTKSLKLMYSSMIKLN